MGRIPTARQGRSTEAATMQLTRLVKVTMTGLTRRKKEKAVLQADLRCAWHHGLSWCKSYQQLSAPTYCGFGRVCWRQRTRTLPRRSSWQIRCRGWHSSVCVRKMYSASYTIGQLCSCVFRLLILLNHGFTYTGIFLNRYSGLI